jgi:hypothetical protein
LEFDMPITAALIGGGLGLLGGVLSGNSAEDAARAQAAGQTEAARLAAEESRFRPVGITTRFGSSQFQTGGDGRVSGASYELNPELRALQDRFLGLAGGGLTQAEMAQQQFAPLQGAGQSLFGLGQQYLAQSPEEAAQQYMMSQQNLLAPSREREFAQLQNRLFNTGRGGLSVGATGTRPSGAAGLGATTPEMEAYYNAIAQQDAALAAQATEAGQRQVAFGAGLFGTGGNLLTQGYQGQAGALAPYEAYLRGATSLEALGQSPLDIGAQLGGRMANPTGAQALLQGGIAAAGTQARADAYNPFATALVGASRDPRLTDAFGRMFSGGGDARGYMPTNFGTGSAFGNQDLGAFL